MLALGLAVRSPLEAQVTFDRIVNAEREPQNWLSYSATLETSATAGSTQIDTQQRREPRARSGSGKRARSRSSRLRRSSSTASSIPCRRRTTSSRSMRRRGRMFWTYHHETSPTARTCCGRVNRGLAILGDTLYMGTIDAHLLAIDAKSGTLIWDVTSPTLRGITRSRCRRTSSRTKSSSARPAGTSVYAVTSPRSTRRPAKRCGASTRFRRRRAR